MGLVVNIDGCQGHGQCYTYCPDVFAPDVEGYATVTVDIVPPEHEQSALEARDACPEHAITVSESP